ncbi:MarR family transcriptional regulator [Flavobacterium sp. 270]|uniref:MarR family winged helix-turn-helix transcriptional regulator n=1 Tax=Flavobacterium sp. 270 TaxID=2512114 RepID=UPI0010EB9A77|nr:MarR family transcriptional regulator [Flavobacterium sp. 270]TDW48144.1 MarR family transcriptional regulator [Flavobacterium sp. 270]
MSTINSSLLLLMNIAKVQSIIARRFDKLSVHGLGFSDFVILNLLEKNPDEKMRRIDLAEKIGLTASGVTRLLLPMEKTGLIKRESNERDGRVSYVVVTEAGKRIYEEAKHTAELIASELLPAGKAKNLKVLSDILFELGGDIQ